MHAAAGRCCRSGGHRWPREPPELQCRQWPTLPHLPGWLLLFLLVQLLLPVCLLVLGLLSVWLLLVVPGMPPVWLLVLRLLPSVPKMLRLVLLVLPLAL